MTCGEGVYPGLLFCPDVERVGSGLTAMQYSGGPPTFVPRAPRSSAIKIVRPPAEGEKKPAETTPDRPLSSASQQRGRADTFTSSSSTGSDSLSDTQGNQLCREYVLNGSVKDALSTQKPVPDDRVQDMHEA
jgi:hypothetical protein